MNKAIGILVLALFLCSTTVLADRYYIKPHNKEIGKYIEQQIDVRHKFGEVFSANLEEDQVKNLKKYADIEKVEMATINGKPMEEPDVKIQGRSSPVLTLTVTSPKAGQIYSDLDVINISAGFGQLKKPQMEHRIINAELYNANGELVQSIFIDNYNGLIKTKYMRIPYNEVIGNAVVRITVPILGQVQEIPISIIHRYNRSSYCENAFIPLQMNGVRTMNGGNGGNGVKIAILDTGIDMENANFAGRIVDCKSFVDYKNDCNEDNVHGTHVAGIAAGNGKIIGMAPEANIMALKVMDYRGAGYWDDIATAITYAADNGANVISMSLGGSYADTNALNAIKYANSKGVLVVASAGNSGPNPDTMGYPGAFKETVAVGALDENLNVFDFSSRGINDGDYIVEDREVELAAPGIEISTYPNDCYNSLRGTSMAAPNIAGQAARLWQGSLTRDYLHSIAVDILPEGDDTMTGFGMPVDIS